MNREQIPEFSDDSDQVIDSIRRSKIILPIIIGMLVIFYLVYQQLDLEELSRVKWTPITAFWLVVAIISYSLRHLMYSWRLRILSEGDFSWLKSIELVTILEFASAVSPTNFGGSAVAFFLLIQERIEGARATAIVLYTIIADTLFFVVTIPLLYIIFGRIIFIPDDGFMTGWGAMDVTLLIVWLIMAGYGLLLTYGLFVEPKHLRRLLNWFAKWKIFGSTRNKIKKAAADIETSSREIRFMPISFHAKLAGITLFAWIVRFFTVTAILIALNPSMQQSLMDHIILLGRGEALYAITAYSPTPGGSGVAEIIFGTFYGEYISSGIAVIAAIIWRLITYYPYLILGVIIIPNWLRKLVNRRRVINL
jgi:uncharacterized protein (TIRG00374 family)